MISVKVEDNKDILSNETRKRIIDNSNFYIDFMRRHNLRIPKVPPLVPIFDQEPFATEKEYIESIQRQLVRLS